MTTDSAETPKTSKAPKTPKTPKTASTPKEPTTSQTPKLPKAPKASKTPETPKAASTLKEPNAANAPQASQAPKSPKELEEAQEPNTPKLPNKSKKPRTPKKPKTPKVEIEPEIDAAEHHAALAKAPEGNQYKYDPNLTAEGCRKHATRNMSGRFVCSPCKFKKQHTWGSGVICTELFLSRSNTYRAVICGQQCKRCNKYGKLELDVEKYVERVLDTFALWRGLREARRPDSHVSKGPHDSSRCYGCQRGICNKSDLDMYNYNSDDSESGFGLYNYNSNSNKYLSSFVRRIY
ncbi:hypothetical protein BKA57DRAFT_444195 [Linnemannia elongata]|nr:hypothetical protein BKA57DRAFT_444195 [Linnemannia elongata]